MKLKEEYALVLNHITTFESYPQFKETFDDYKQTAFFYLNHKGKSLFEDEILALYSKDKTLEEIFSWNPDRFIQGANKERKGKREKTWYDIMSMEVIEAEDSFFDFFFACKLRQIDLLEIDNYLSFHLENNFDKDRSAFLRFLNITVRKYEKKLLSTEMIDTVNEWIKISEITEGAEDEKPFKIKGRLEREPGDKLTSLTLVQTALLIKYMQEAKLILKSDNLNYTQAGKAFHILTAYSAHTLRQQLGIKGEIDSAKHEDYKELHAVILQLAKLIDPDKKTSK